MNKVEWLNSQLWDCFNSNVSEKDAQADAKYLFELACEGCEGQSQEVIDELKQVALSYNVKLD